MPNGDDSFSMSTKQENTTVPPPPPPRETPTGSHPPRETDLTDDKAQSLLNSLRSTSLTPQEAETCMRSLTNLMTSSKDEDDALFQEVISKLNGREFLRMADLLTPKSDDRYFLEIARNKNGSIRLQKLLGKSSDADVFFLFSILRNFFRVMTDQHASRVAAQGMRVFSHNKKRAMRNLTLRHAVPLARTRHGSIMLRKIITDDDFEYCRHYLLGKVAFNALSLSYDTYGNSVVLDALKHGSLHSTRNFRVSLRGHYAELSFTENGRYIVEKLLERDDETEALVVAELLKCEGDELVRLATSAYGHFVVEKALKVTRVDLFKGLVNKLKPSLPLFRSSHQSTTIAETLESVR